ncbi:hypothetical protein ACFPVX_02610 [Cohnella faecalis]|uniref:Uncharacterized protein n=1 Tax=Cohnella faecalis TaxID=2315694 RepID=A0A398CV98_9BACL|nr:hypothetical protein [Cohnella faecalis]RIE05209.1 hypothetical protein D3H35_01425 [Cohnella faecalis]
MLKLFLKPLRILLGIYLIGSLSIASDIAQLTDFNILDVIKNHSPFSYYILITGTLFLYTILVIIEFARKNSSQATSTSNISIGQTIRTHNVKNSTIIQIKKDKEG